MMNNGDNDFKFVYQPSLVDESINYVRKAVVYVDELIKNIQEAGSITIITKIVNLDFIISNYMSENLEVIRNYEQIINDMKLRAEISPKFINFESQEVINNVIYAFVNKIISPEEFMSIANQYMHYILEECPKKYNELTYSYTKTPMGIQIANKMGINGIQNQENLINDINLGLAKYMIDNDYMYTGTGVVEYINTFNGMLAMLGIRMGYENNEFDQPAQGLYLGTREQKLSVVDCCNLYDWAARGVGLDIYAYGAGTHYNYGIDINDYVNFTPENEYKSVYGDDYFFNAKIGDIMENRNSANSEAGHLRIIVGKDDNGYYTVENGKGMEYRYYTYEELKNTEYHISNMDAVYRNTSRGNKQVNYLNNNKLKRFELSNTSAEEIRADYENGSVFLTPNVFKEELNLENEYINKLNNQYNERNQRKSIDVKL